MDKYLYITSITSKNKHYFDEPEQFNYHDYFDYASQYKIWLYKNGCDYFQFYEFRKYHTMLQMLLDYFECEDSNNFNSILKDLVVFRSDYPNLPRLYQK